MGLIKKENLELRHNISKNIARINELVAKNNELQKGKIQVEIQNRALKDEISDPKERINIFEDSKEKIYILRNWFKESCL
ncbi:hypothetical protein MTHERMMSTA1_07720 [Methanosarcina thermophila MST-A1]|jgi:predicted nuclease with TOPRIM domain|uniref:Cell shape-determining protein MreC n=1 Tax=Methanosarcina thermophila TaxID=2210 RepID=A0A3G9CW80_METTE|nr:hypothetical protein [Methanosarcina thermophila]ALK05435.1 MAG: hypothetical protein AAY43_06620 [Methanosarcina sp. 795]NLU56165.1 hypothetical protein [Methanosarcina thermophila]BAW29307.1 cell shape-determining protein MreC [Methanosarcina thermophila]GLI13646.1 hypothetical protein MTHERMMSTA1_07720 [Methanosarcina thermophila MST-A1]HOA68040.1 hypothetical protein [Methanosarcina thermophila]